MRVAIVRFPGSNCDQDAFHAVRKLGHESEYVWHAESIPAGFDAVILPGGFSFGDYLRCGAVARFSPAMESVQQMAREGTPVLGICNGFQVLCECGLLPGALVRNVGLRFVCRDVLLRVETTDAVASSGARVGQVLRIPVAHGEGCYVPAEGEAPRVVFRYCNAAGETTPESNPNGSHDNIAGISNREGNVVGMMPHPERAVSELLGYQDGRVVLKSFLTARHAARR
ncbi:MAG: phosphoribosylformylglycinamidine synthase I [Fimbriimonadia bacterium]